METDKFFFDESVAGCALIIKGNTVIRINALVFSRFDIGATSVGSNFKHSKCVNNCGPIAAVDHKIQKIIPLFRELHQAYYL